MNGITMAQITPLASLEQLGMAQKATGADSTSLFRSIFEEAVTSVKESEQNLADKQFRLVTGEIDDPHTVSVAAAQASLSVTLLAQLRNSALTSYNQLMNLSI